MRILCWLWLAALGGRLVADDCARLFHQGALASAEACLQEQARLQPQRARAWYRLGLVRAARGHYRAAADAQRLAVAHAHELGQAYCALALDLRESNQSVEGLSAAREAVRCLPAYAGAWNLLGNLALDNGLRDLALQAYGRALSLQPDYPGAWFNRAQLMERGRFYDQARQDYSRALAQQPDFAEARLGRAELALAHGSLDDAEDDFRRLTLGGDSQPEGWWGLDRVAKARGQSLDAKRCQERYRETTRDRDRRLDRWRRAGHEDLQPYEPGLPLPPLPGGQ